MNDNYYGFTNYQYKDLGKANDVIGSAKINKGLESSVDAVIKNDVGVVMKKTKNADIKQNVEIFNNISAPVTKGQKIGEVVFFLDEKEIAKVDLIASKDIAKYGLGSMITKVYKNWFTFLMIYNAPLMGTAYGILLLWRLL